jgi:ribosomal protein L11 methylase PrmA
MRRTALLGLIDSLEKAVNSLRWKPKETEWNDYYNRTNYSLKAQQHKRQVVSGLIRDIKPTTVWDLGANTGVFSRIAAENGALTVSFDMDPACVEKNYLQENAEKNGHILPLQLDLTNPSPAIGWGNTERMSLMQRGPADAVLALAIIHHLAIANNLPFCKIAHFMSEICDNLIIEFIPKSDSQLRRLLASRDDIFIEYNQASFEHEFSAYFTVDKAIRIEESERIIYSMKNKRGCL